MVAEFQPIVDLSGGRVTGAQALPRYGQAGLTVGLADLDAIEEQGLTGLFVEQVFELVCASQRALDSAGIELHLWMRMPHAALSDLTLPNRLGSIVRGSHADPQRLVCALDPRTVQHDLPAALGVLARLRVFGIALCLDDFTENVTGEQLERAPLTAVRLSAELVSGAAGSDARILALQEAIDAARAAGLAVAADGGATVADVELLSELGCDQVQGAFIAPPMSAGELARWTSDWTAPPIFVDGST